MIKIILKTCIPISLFDNLKKNEKKTHIIILQNKEQTRHMLLLKKKQLKFPQHLIKCIK